MMKMKTPLFPVFVLAALSACSGTASLPPLTGPLVDQQVTETLVHKGLRGAQGADREPRLVQRTYFFACQSDFTGALAQRVADAKAVAFQHSGYVLPGNFALLATRRGITNYTNRRIQETTGCMLKSADDEIIIADATTVGRFLSRPEVARELLSER
jgi:hypothetical protein